MKRFMLFSLAFLMPAIALADEVIPLDKVLESIFDLAKNAKGMGWIALCAAIILIILQLLKTNLVKQWFNKLGDIYKRLVLFGLTFLLAMFNALAAGMKFFAALGSAVASVGGAMAVYEVFKPFMNKLIAKMFKEKDQPSQ